jgi:hypothetical protein
MVYQTSITVGENAVNESEQMNDSGAKPTPISILRWSTEREVK